jgi:DNA oxidative demethylase
MPDSQVTLVLPKGVHLIPGYLDPDAQARLLETVRKVVAEAPLYRPEMPRTGKPMSVRMTNCGPYGWVTDQQRGYRYQHHHPVTGRPWPPMPTILETIWDELTCYDKPAQACLINYYDSGAKMGLHQDRDEEDLAAPVVSLSLGDACMFRVGGAQRRQNTVSFRLNSGDALTFSGPSRLAYHGVDRIIPDSSALLKRGGRINLTLRRVTLDR